ncbi:glycosyltransferase family 71 protein [[Candida] arabinofermentans NRRL YB-2248]|uniref:Glycosyltransferase family 71 protein n=1 Tax=[Candida] arabinofermentans NRRL YB-2248 TaxID=983967 RepID=A0A1E4SZ38_9ASCO|nr:glycosyltransferase family 71 protein [[Candida] arabinofermentans NRRL YB-2248]
MSTVASQSLSRGSSKYAKPFLLALLALVILYTVVVVYELRATDDEEVDMKQYIASSLTTYIDSKNVKESYFTGDQKEPLDAEVIRKLIASESDKFENDREIALQEEDEKNKDPVTESVEEFQQLFAEFTDVLIKNRLLFPHPERITTNNGKPVIWETKFVELPYDMLSENDLLNYMDFDKQFIEDLTKKHKKIVQSLPKSEINFYKGDGYVMVGGGLYTWVAFLSIQALRKTGSTLPLELIIPNDDDYETNLCDDILPNQYNTKCVKLSTVFGAETLNKVGELKGYQFKSFALLASSFENIMYLDSDNFAVENPDHLLTSSLYKRYGMITWPDFWRRTSSPYLYQILGIKVGAKPIRQINDFYTPSEKYTKKSALIDVEDSLNLHDRKGTLADWTTESGQFLLNKRKHFNSLLLALYYNFDGPAGYHPLLSQGGAGEGDKETLVLAAHYLKLPYYQLYKKPDKLYGTFIKEANYFIDSTMVQYDPITDYESLKMAISKNQKSLDALGNDYVYSYMYTYGSIPFENDFLSRPMFYHIHNPKMNPWTYLEKELFFDPKFKQLRNFGNDFGKIGWDIELWIWETVVKNLCGTKLEDGKFDNSTKIEFKYFDNMGFNTICNNTAVDDRIKWLTETGKIEIEKYTPKKYNEKYKLTDEESNMMDDLIYTSITKMLEFDYIN